jgi:uncharacterized lipoprotein
MNTFKFITGAGLTILLAACSAATTERKPSSDSTKAETSGGPIEGTAAQPTAGAPAPAAPSPSPAVKTTPSGGATEEVVRVPEAVLRNPQELMPLMQQMRSQIVYKTKKIPEAQYEQLVRPSLVDQLRSAGFAQDDVDAILSDVDYSRRIRGIR